MTALAYLGPPGTFTEEALLTLSIAEGADLVPMPTIPAVVRAVVAGDAEAGLVPIENSIEGSVNITLDTLAFEADDPIQIRAEVVRPIRHALLGQPGARLGDISDVVSHPHATAQCRGFLERALPQASVRAANSTAEAARDAAARGRGWAASGVPIAAELHGLVVLEADIEDRDENATPVGRSR